MSSLTRSTVKVVGAVGVLLVAFWITLKILDLASPPAGVITIVEATYGSNCNVPTGNWTKATADQCDKSVTCTFNVDLNRFGDPAPGCSKEFSVQWRCAGAPAIEKATMPAEAAWKTVEMTCQQ
jgi:hypothetical protein